MSFTISVSPDYLQPAYNDLTYRVYETGYTQSTFKYIFQTYVNGSLINTSKLYPRPADGYCNFNPSHILQQYISREYRPALAAHTEASTNEMIQYRVDFKYEYGGTTYSAAVGATQVLWNGVAQYHDAIDITTFVSGLLPTITSSTKPDLLNFIYKGDSVKKGIYLYEDDKRTISFFRKDLGTCSVSDIYLIVKCHDGQQKGFSYKLPAVSSNYYSYINHFPLGIEELNNITWSGTSIPVGKSNTITLTEDYGFELRLRDSEGNNTHDVYYFTFKQPCKYKHYTIAYQTSLGGYGYINFDMKNYKDIQTEKVVYDKIMPYNYTTSNRSTTTYGNLAQGQIQLNTNWILEQDLITEIKDMILSPELYLIDQDGVQTPVYIDKWTFNERNVDQDEMIQYTFTFIEAFKLNTIK